MIGISNVNNGRGSSFSTSRTAMEGLLSRSLCYPAGKLRKTADNRLVLWLPGFTFDGTKIFTFTHYSLNGTNTNNDFYPFILNFDYRFLRFSKKGVSLYHWLKLTFIQKRQKKKKIQSTLRNCVFFSFTFATSALGWLKIHENTWAVINERRWSAVNATVVTYSNACVCLRINKGTWKHHTGMHHSLMQTCKVVQVIIWGRRRVLRGNFKVSSAPVRKFA